MLTEGMFIADRYEVVGVVGAGGMSDVYKAKDHVLGRFVAIKVLKQEFSEDVNFVTKFRTEAQSAAGLEHPNIVNIYDVGSENGMHYIVMEFVEGITLKTYIEKKGRLTYKEAVSIAIQVGRGIEAAHHKNIVHRDIKPQNIIISTEGKVKVTDFGIARAATSNTINSDVMGSVHYASPEQARNGFVDGKSDIYSLGIVMYEMVTGRVPFDGDTTVAVAIQHLQEEMVTPSAYASDLPISVEKIILKSTQKNPDRRYESMGDLLLDLKKSLISPNEDFVTMIPLVNKDKTRVISEDELNLIKESRDGIGDADEGGETVSGEDDEEEGGGILNPKMEKAVTIAGIVAAVIIVGIVICLIGNILGIFKFGGKRKNPDTEISTELDTENMQEMIDLRGLTFAEAKNEIKDKGLDIKLKEGDTVSSDEYEEGQIAEQSIEAGDEVAAGGTVTVNISSGAGDINIPNVVGYKSSEATQILEDAGFKVSTDYEYSDTVQADYVIRTEPGSDAKAKKGDTITIWLSRGVEMVQVPNVVGKTEAEAKADLEAEDLGYNVTSAYSDSVEKGRIISQNPVEKNFVDKGTTITITVSLGKETTVYKYDTGTLTAPNDGKTYTGGKFRLCDPAGNLLWGSDEFTGTSNSATISNIKNIKSGTLYVDWYYTQEDGTKGTNTVTYAVEFKEQS